MSQMSRRNFLKTSFGGALSVSALGQNSWKGNVPPRNVVLILTDQQPTGTMGCYGNPLKPTPNLDGLARTGLRFTNSYIGAYPCSPSRASLLTGLYPQGHGVYTNEVLLEESVPTLGSILKEAGWDTAYFGKNHLGGATYRDVPGGRENGEDGQSYYDPFNNGHHYMRRVPDEKDFRFEKVPGGPGEDTPQHRFTTWAGGWKDYRAYLREVGLGRLVDEHPLVGNHYDIPSTTEDQHQYSLLPEEHHMEAFFTKKAIEFLGRRRGARKPFGLVLSYFGPHLPVAPPRPWDDKYALDRISLPANHADLLEGKPDELKKNSRCYVLPTWTDTQFKDYVRRYFGYAAYIDHQIGRVLKALRDNGLEDNTIVVFTTDHGDMMAAHGCIFKIGTGYEELANVPFLIRVPGMTKPGSVSDGLINSVDLLPTLIDLLDLAPLKNAHGLSFRKNLVQLATSERRRIFSHWGPRSFFTYDGEWKYHLHWKGDLDELYNLKEDPGELKNLAKDVKYADVARQKRREIFEWLQETGHPYAKVIENTKRERSPEGGAALL